MKYNNDLNYLNEEINYFDTLIEEIKNIDLESEWSGYARNFLTDSLNDNVNCLKMQRNYLNKYNRALNLMERYVEIDQKINELYASLPSGDDKEAQKARALIYNEIAKLQTEKNRLRTNILSLLDSIGLIDVLGINEILYSYDGEFEYAVDLESLVKKFTNSEINIIINDLYGLYDFVDENGNIVKNSGQEYVDAKLNEVLEKYSGREAVVNSILVVMQLAADKGNFKLRYINSGQNWTAVPYNNNVQMSDGMDCCSFVSWALNKGTKYPFHWEDVGQLAEKGTEIDYSNALPGDVCVTTENSRHVSMIIENDTESKTVIVAEAKSPEAGIVLTVKTYDELKTDNYGVYSYESYYNGEKSNA